MTVTAPPRPPRPSGPVDREELEALVEALIEEARQRARRRRRIYGAVAALVALLGVTVFTVFERAAQSQTASPALAARSSLPPGTADAKIAFISAPLRCPQCNVPRGDLYVMNADGSGQRVVTRNVSGMWGDAVWSPDGRKIGFARDGISVVNADGSGERSLTGGYAAVWSPDGQKIAFTRSRDRWKVSDVYVINADGSGQRRLTHSTRDMNTAWVTNTAWLPDGRIAFVRITSRRNPTFEVYVMNADGSGQHAPTPGPNTPVWTNTYPSASLTRDHCAMSQACSGLRMLLGEVDQMRQTGLSLSGSKRLYPRRPDPTTT